MRTLKTIISVFIVLAASFSLAAQETESNGRKHIVLGERIQKDTTGRRSLKSYVIIPKGEVQIGASVAYADLSGDNSEFFLLLNDATAKASVLRLAPAVSYAYMDNQAIGARFQYTVAHCALDAATLDLLGNFDMTVNDLKASTRSYAGYVYNRSYVGLDNRGRVGIFIDAGVGYTWSQSIFGNTPDCYSRAQKISLSMSPGFVYFPMNFVSCYASISLADVTYGMTKVYEAGEVIGSRNTLRAQAHLNLLALNFGIAIHL